MRPGSSIERLLLDDPLADPQQYRRGNAGGFDEMQFGKEELTAEAQVVVSFEIVCYSYLNISAREMLGICAVYFYHTFGG